MRASYRTTGLGYVLTVHGARRTTPVGAKAEAEATIPAHMTAANLMLQTRQNHEEEHDEVTRAAMSVRYGPSVHAVPVHGKGGRPCMCSRRISARLMMFHSSDFTAFQY